MKRLVPHWIETLVVSGQTMMSEGAVGRSIQQFDTAADAQSPNVQIMFRYILAL